MKKSIKNFLFVLVYHNILFLILIPKIYLEPIYVIALLTFQVINLADALVQYTPKHEPGSQNAKKPEKKAIATEEEEKGGFKWTFMKGMILLNLLLPIFLFLAYYENIILIIPFLAFWNSVFVQYAGIIIMLAGGLFIIVGRVILGESIRGAKQENHELKIQGIYGYTRNPIYTGMFLELLGAFLVFKSIAMLSISVSLILTIILKQILREEKWLEKRHGEEYLQYKKKTKRLIPFIL